MKSEDTKRIIIEIAEEEGLSDWAVELIVKSQFKGVNDIITSAIPDNPETFKSVRLNAFCQFHVMKGVFKRFRGKKKITELIRKRYDAKKRAVSPVLGRGKQSDSQPQGPSHP